MNTKVSGDTAELAVALDLRRQGHKVAFPFGENWDADIVVEAHGRLHRVQVKHTRSDGVTIAVRCYTQTIVAGRSRSVRSYTADDIEWLAVYDATTGQCIYLPPAEFSGRTRIHVRYQPCQRNRTKDVRFVDEFRVLRAAPHTIRATGP